MRLFSIACVIALTAAAAASAAEKPTVEDRLAALEKAARAPFKFGIVSEAEVLDNLEEKKDIDADIQLGEQKALEILIPIRKACEQLSTEIPMLGENSDDRKAKEAELEARKNELARKYEMLRNNLQQEAQKRLNEIRIKIRQHIAEYAREHNYALVIERNALLYGEEGKSLTTAVIDRMNTEYFKAKYEEEEEDEDGDENDAGENKPAPQDN